MNKTRQKMNLQNMSVLIVDDHQNMCRLVKGMLKSLGYGRETFFAPNGVLAWKNLKAYKIDLAIIDWNMPMMNGTQLLNRIREDKKFRDMPVIMVTGEAGKDVIAEAVESEIDAYIIKPFSAKVLGERIEHVFDRLENPSSMYYHLNRARDFEEDESFSAAMVELKLAMKAEPRSSIPVRHMGQVQLKKNNLAGAEKWLLKAIELNNRDSLAYHLLGEFHLKRNEIGRAMMYIEKAVHLNPRHTHRGINFSKLLFKKKMFDKGIKVLASVLTTDPDNEEARELLARHKSVKTEESATASP